MFNGIEFNKFFDELKDILPQEDINEIKREPESINDIPELNLNPDSLNQLKFLIDSTSRENISELLTNLSKLADINPNKNVFSSASIKGILQYRLKKKINQIKKEKEESPINVNNENNLI